MKTLNDFAEYIKGNMSVAEVYFNSTPIEFIEYAELLHKDIERKSNKIKKLTTQLVKYEDKYGKLKEK